MKILIIKRDKIGDMLLMTPMLEHLKKSRPEAEVHVLANDYNAWVVQDNPFIDRLWIYPRVRHGAELRPLAALTQLWQMWALRRQRFDVAIAAGGGFSQRAIGRAVRIGAKRSIAYCDASAEGQRFAAQLTDPLPLSGLHEVEANLNLLSPLGLALPTQPIRPSIRPYFPLPQRWLDFGKQWVAERGLDRQGFIVIGLNARRDKRKPTLEQVLAWSNAVHQKHGLATVFIWQPGEAGNRVYPGDDARVAELAADPPAHLHPFRSADDIMPVLGVLWQARAAVLPDGGIAHLASMSPGGVISLFAETTVSPHPDFWRPVGPRADYLEADKSVAELPDALVLDRLDRLLACYPDALPGSTYV
jgi:ADP-heptose:LPS heptosyltransferase